MTSMAVHHSSKRQDWETPQTFFDKLNAEFDFSLDVCASSENAKCEIWLTEREDGLVQPWKEWALDGAVWMNPPYGRQIGKWVKKAYEESRLGATVVCLLPSRTDTRWWHEYCMKGEIRFVPGRLYFSNADRAPFPSAVVVFRRRTA